MLDFAELPADGTAFELLIRELLFSRGYRVNWSGQGADGGRDLLCVERGDELLGGKERLWLVQCKHNAHSSRAVGVDELEPIIDSCAQHDADGYLLACSTYPSAATVARLVAVEQTTKLKTAYLDAPQLERLLSTPKEWPIAQRFLPRSAGSSWRVWATDQPNHWIVAHKGFRLHLMNRIGSNIDYHLPSISARIAEIEALSDELPSEHELRPRGVYFNDKSGSYVWYVDYLVPSKEEPALDPYELGARLGHDNALEDGLYYAFEILVEKVSRSSDHFDPDHYDFYNPYLRAFETGRERDWRRDSALEDRDELEE